MASYPNLDGDSIKYSRITNDTLKYSRITAPTKDSAESDSSNQGTAPAYTFDNYQDDAGTTAIYSGAGTCDPIAANYCILGLAGEAGEIANRWKKLYRDAPSFATHPDEYRDFYDKLRGDILDELGDVLWYVANLSTELGFYLGEVANSNIQKLQNRKSRGTLTGSGDDR